MRRTRMPISKASRCTTSGPMSTRRARSGERRRKTTMAEDWPKIVSRRTIPVSPWMRLMERAVEFTPGAQPEIYHAIEQQDYIAIVARTADGLFPIVRQYRPALEKRTWELPAGMLENGEDPAECCRRELFEETGLKARAVHSLGAYAPCTARL